MVAIALEGLGGILFTLGSTLGAYLLVRIHPLMDGCFVQRYCDVRPTFIEGLKSRIMVNVFIC